MKIHKFWPNQADFQANIFYWWVAHFDQVSQWSKKGGMGGGLWKIPLAEFVMINHIFKNVRLFRDEPYLTYADTFSDVSIIELVINEK